MKTEIRAIILIAKKLIFVHSLKIDILGFAIFLHTHNKSKTFKLELNICHSPKDRGFEHSFLLFVIFLFIVFTSKTKKNRER